MKEIAIPAINMNGDDPHKLVKGLSEAADLAYKLKIAIAQVEYDNGRNANSFEHAQDMRFTKMEMVTQANNIEVTLVAIIKGIQRQLRIEKITEDEK